MSAFGGQADIELTCLNVRFLTSCVHHPRRNSCRFRGILQRPLSLSSARRGVGPLEGVAPRWPPIGLVTFETVGEM
jgi:hypothetical protein